MARLGGAHAILKALGVIPLYPENYATVCAAKQVSVPYLDLSAAEGLSRYLCGYFRTDVGFLAKYVKEGKAPQWIIDNLETIEIIEQKTFNTHNFFENLRLAFTFPKKINPPKGGP